MAFIVRFRYNDRVQNIEEKKLFAKEMRKHPTPAETILWDCFRRKQLGVKVSRQRVILGYIADFYIPTARLVIECDGCAHNQQYDRLRDTAMSRKGFKVLRFSNSDCLLNTELIINVVKEAIATRHFTASMP